MTSKFSLTLFLASFVFLSSLSRGSETLRPPAVPLVACDPYFSIWSAGDELAGVETTHWTGKPHRLSSVVSIDGVAYRVLGAEPAGLPALPQASLQVLPTRTCYSFAGGGVVLEFSFMTPALPEDIDLLSRPVTYVAYSLKSSDGRAHEARIRFAARGEIAVNRPDEEVIAEKTPLDGLAVARVGAKRQAVLEKSGDDIRIDWGHFYLAAGAADAETSLETTEGPCDRNAAGTGASVTLAVAFKPFVVSSESVERVALLAYDDEYSIQYLGTNLRPYWRRNGWQAADLLKSASEGYASLRKRCEAFDDELMDDLVRLGGRRYAQIAALAYRQCFAAGKFVADANGQPLQFSKENHSNGCIGTADVFYPMSPLFLLGGPSLAKSFLVPFLDYAASGRWTFPFAPHDLGRYPLANGQVYGGGEKTLDKQMPVEECGNLLILVAAVAHMENSAAFAERYWPLLERWAVYLRQRGYDPENQLCTDDFAGHLAHNVNLSAKAICGLGAFARLCELRGDTPKAEEYFRLARGFAEKWAKEADDGDHYRLAFDRPGTWSQKYNLVWDRLLGLNLFPAEIAEREMAYYRKIQNRYGLPLDGRKGYTKLDWITWTATLTQKREDFEALLDPVFDFVNGTPDRSPLTDWYRTNDARKVAFTARPVVGGVFLRMLYDRPTWDKYAGRDKTRAAGWAKAPKSEEQAR